MTFESGRVIIRSAAEPSAGQASGLARAQRLFKRHDRFPGLDTDEFMALIRDPVVEPPADAVPQPKRA